MLEMRPNCENCDRDLAPESFEARICSFECTFCDRCADHILGGICPNCTGELLPRPARPCWLLERAPGAELRTNSEVDVDAHLSMLASREVDADRAGVVLRRYVDAWQGGDLERLVDCYHPDFTIHYAGTSRFAGVHAGRDAAIGVMAEVSILAARELLSVDQVLVDDRAGALVVTERLTRDGDSVVVQRTLLYRVSEGRLIECHLLEHDQPAVDHMWRP